MAKAALGLETDMRRDLFAHVQRLPVSFHDRWPSGQLLSRLTTDLSTLRRFIGFGFVFLIANSASRSWSSRAADPHPPAGSGCSCWSR